MFQYSEEEKTCTSNWKRLGSVLLPLLTVLLAAVYPLLFLYFQNANEARFSEIAAALAIFAGVASALYFLCLAILRSPVKGAVAATLLVLVMENFSLLESALKLLFPSMRYWHTAPVIMVITLHLIWLVFRFVKEENLRVVVQVTSIVFAGLILLNGVFAIPQIISRMETQKQLSEVSENQQDGPVAGTMGRPNVYLFIFDEYANFTQMEQYYHYDNAPLREFLEKYNFNISLTSHNENIWTTTVVTNLLNLEYTVDADTLDSEKEVIRKNGNLFKLMRDYGYKVQTIETGNFISNTSIHGGVEGKQGALTAGGEDLVDLAVGRTIAYPLYQQIVKSASNNLASVASLAVANYMASEEMIPASDTLTVGYVNLPHAPFLFDENGGAVPITMSANWRDDRYYLGQYVYTTKLMMNILENVLIHDRDAVILLMSDHGARASTDSELFMEKFPMDVMNNPLNAVFFRGERIDIEGLSSVNTLRCVLNHLLDAGLEMVEVPSDY